MNMNTHFYFRLRATALAAALLLTLGASLSHAQINLYARFANGNAPWAGDSIDAGRTGWVNLKSASFGSSIPVTIGGGGGTTYGNATFDSVVLTKAVNRLTPQIFASLASGLAINGGPGVADVTLDFVKTGSAGPVTFFRVELRLASFTQQKTTSSEGDSALDESVTLKNAAFRYTFWTILPNGTQGASQVQAWSLVNNTATFTP